MTEQKIWFEKLYSGFGQYFSVKYIVLQKRTKYQNVTIFENDTFGKVMSLDNIIQLTEYDEFIYHEMISHVPLFSIKNAHNLLIIGGGDGGLLKEVCKHKNIKQITLVEIDEEVIKISKRYFSKFWNTTLGDKRINIIISDGLKYLYKCNKMFDIIISDCTDPVGPGKQLFTNDFYSNCYKCLNDSGIFISQNGVSLMQMNEIVRSYNKLSKYFNTVRFYQADVPSYHGGNITFAYATNNTSLNNISLKYLQKRFHNSEISCKYYTPLLHIRSFTLPQYLISNFKKCKKEYE